MLRTVHGNHLEIDHFVDAVLNDVPLVVRDGLPHGQSGETVDAAWSDEAVLHRFPFMDVMVERNLDTDPASRLQEMPIFEFLERFHAHGWHSTTALAQHQAETIEVPPAVICLLQPKETVRSMSIRMNGNQHNPMIHHNGDAESLILQLSGTQRVSMLPAEAASVGAVSLHEFAINYASLNASPVHPASWASLAVHPSYGAVKGKWIEVDLQPGDLLYIPSYWLHFAQSETRTVYVEVLFEKSATGTAHVDTPPAVVNAAHVGTACEGHAKQASSCNLQLHCTYELAKRREMVQQIDEGIVDATDASYLNIMGPTVAAMGPASCRAPEAGMPPDPRTLAELLPDED